MVCKPVKLANRSRFGGRPLSARGERRRKEPMSLDAILIQVDTEAGAVEAFGEAANRADRMRGHVRGERGGRRREPPGERGDDRGYVQRRRAGDARLSGLAGN